MAVTLLYWKYMCSPRIKDERRAAELFIPFHEDVTILVILPRLFTGWLERVTEKDLDRADLLGTLRKALCARTTSSAHRKALQIFLFHLVTRPTVQHDIKDAWGTSEHPVYWALKSAQLGLGCRRDEESSKIVHGAVDCVLCVAIFCCSILVADPLHRHFCKSHGMSMMEVCHSWYGIPLLPYLANVAGMCTDPVEETLASSEFLVICVQFDPNSVLITCIRRDFEDGRP